MKWFQNVSTRSKLFLGFGIVVAMLVVISVISKTGLSSIEGSQKIIFEKEFVNSTDLLRLKAKYDEIRMALLSMMSAPDQGVKERWHQNIKTNAEEIAVLMEIGIREIRPALTATCQSLGRNRMRESIQDGISLLMLVRTLATWMTMQNGRRRKHGCAQRTRR